MMKYPALLTLVFYLYIVAIVVLFAWVLTKF